MRGKIIGRPCREWKGAEKVSGVWLYAADNIRPGNVVGPGAAQILLPCAHPQHRRQPGKKSARAPASARAHRHMYEEVNDVLSGSGTASSTIAALIGAKTMSGVFPFLAGISISIPRSSGARFLVHHNRPFMENLGFMHIEQREGPDE